MKSLRILSFLGALLLIFPHYTQTSDHAKNRLNRIAGHIIATPGERRPVVAPTAAPAEAPKKYGLKLAEELFQRNIKIYEWIQTKLAPEEVAAKCDAVFSNPEARTLFKEFFNVSFSSNERYEEMEKRRNATRKRLEGLGFTFLKWPGIVTHTAIPGYVVKLSSGIIGIGANIRRVWGKDWIEDAAQYHGRTDVRCVEKYIYCATQPTEPHLAIMVVAKHLNTYPGYYEELPPDYQPENRCLTCGPRVFISNVCGMSDASKERNAEFMKGSLWCIDAETGEHATTFDHNPFTKFRDVYPTKLTKESTCSACGKKSTSTES